MARGRDGGCLSRLFFGVLFVALLALTVYNARQTAVLKAQVADLQAQVSALKAGRRPESPASMPLLEKARTHAERARKYALEGNYKAARAELERSLQELEKAPQTPGASTRATLEDVRKKWDETSKALEKIWSKPEKSRGKGG